MLALRDVAPATVSAAALWLARLQHGDGGWGMSADDSESGWHTAWAVLALAAGGDPLQLDRGQDWLTGVSVVSSSGLEVRAEMEKLLAIDFSVRGLPWLPDQASWVEPTALGILALATTPRCDMSAARVAEATQYLLDRRCRAGGWNFGNPVMLGADLPARAHPTALALLALARAAPEGVEPADLTTLRAQMELDGGALALASGLLALRALGAEEGGTEIALADQQAQDGSWNGNSYHTAIALLAARGTL
jgi:hypothetical protein